MAEEQAEIKTEQPTQRRRDESREQGRVAFSTELNGNVLLFAAAMFLAFNAESLTDGFLRTFRYELHSIHPGLRTRDIVPRLQVVMIYGASGLAFFFLAIYVVGLGVGLAQAGLQFAPQALAPNWSRVNPVEGFSRVFSAAGVVRGALAMLKVAVIAALFTWVIVGRAPQIAGLAEGTLAESARQTWGMVSGLILGLTAALVLVGLIDYGFQRYRHEQKLMMTRQELKEELRRDEGDPRLRSRRRAIAREVAMRKRMLDEVPKATVVITNPTHLAIALQYVDGQMPTPKVIAKGSGEMARRIIEKARRHAVPVVERKLLARALYKIVQVDDEIPAEMFYAVSQVLVYVYKLKKDMAA